MLETELFYFQELPLRKEREKKKIQLNKAAKTEKFCLKICNVYQQLHIPRESTFQEGCCHSVLLTCETVLMSALE